MLLMDKGYFSNSQRLAEIDQIGKITQYLLCLPSTSEIEVLSKDNQHLSDQISQLQNSLAKKGENLETKLDNLISSLKSEVKGSFILKTIFY